MTRFILIISLPVLFCFTSFVIQEEDLLGIWAVNMRTGLYEKVTKQPQNRICFIFKKNGRLQFIPSDSVYVPKEGRKVIGSWKQTSDSTLQIKYYSYVGPVVADWKLKHRVHKKLKYKLISCRDDVE